MRSCADHARIMATVRIDANRRLAGDRERLASSIPNCRTVAARVRATAQDSARCVDRNAVGVAGPLVPGLPAIDDMAPPLERTDRVEGEAAFDMQGIARLAERKAAGQKARQLDRFLDIQAEIDHRGVELQLDLRLAVRPHTAEHTPE